MLLYIRHETRYQYEHPVKHSIQSLRLTPRRDAGQRALRWAITAPGRRVEQTDAYGNITHLLTYEEPHREISIVVSGVVETDGGLAAIHEDEGQLAPLAYVSATSLTRANARIQELAAAAFSKPAPLRERLEGLAATLSDTIRYKPGATQVTDNAATVIERGEGVCQDHAHAFIACCRAAGIPARYVSGYFYTGDGGDIASHAWADAWLGPEEGWLSLDLTHRSLAGERHCRLAVGRDYLDAAPVRGVRQGGGGEAMQVSVCVAESAQQQ